MPTDPVPIDPDGEPLPMRTISITYDAFGRVAAAHDPPGTVRWTDPAVPEPAGPATWFRFDSDGRLIDRGTGPLPGDPPAPPSPDEPPDEPHVVGDRSGPSTERE